MNNLMKAEWFRLRHSGNCLLILLFLGMCAIMLQYSGNRGLEITAEMFFVHSSMGMAIAVGGITALIAGTFNNRLVNYEIMQGTPPEIMVLSKMLMSLMLVTAVYFLPTALLLVIFDRGSITLPMMLLTFICTAKLTVTAIGIDIILKDATGTVIFVFGLAFQSAPLVLLQNILNIDAVKLTPYLTSTQLIIIGNMKVIDLDELYAQIRSANNRLIDGARPLGLDAAYYVQQYAAELGSGPTPSERAAQIQAERRERLAKRRKNREVWINLLASILLFLLKGCGWLFILGLSAFVYLALLLILLL